MIFPADSPMIADISGFGISLRLETSSEITSTTIRLNCEAGSIPVGAPSEILSPDGVRLIFAEKNSRIDIPEGTQEFVLTTLENENSWIEGRAGMQYRDLIPSRLGGRFIASHIRIPVGGQVPDYVHFHKIRFQMIYCISGWARLVYEDQGEPFIMKAGDCVLQPPEIRHRVLESSAGLEVLEISCPAVHETFADHDLELPNSVYDPERMFGGQQFVHQINENAVWEKSEFSGLESRESGISKASKGFADVRTFRATRGSSFSLTHMGEFLMLFVLNGELSVKNSTTETHEMKHGSCVTIPAVEEFSFAAENDLEFVMVKLPATSFQI